jgi:ribosomal protein S18 acetylase RimI-like enzyme
MLDPNEHVVPYNTLHVIEDYRGYLVWRYSTGNTAELLHLDTLERRKGYGSSLIHDMLLSVDRDKACVVYGFTRANKVEAQVFYAALGFKLKLLPDLYYPQDGVLFTQTHHTLMEKFNAGR